MRDKNQPRTTAQAVAEGSARQSQLAARERASKRATAEVARAVAAEHGVPTEKPPEPIVTNPALEKRREAGIALMQALGERSETAYPSAGRDANGRRR